MNGGKVGGDEGRDLEGKTGRIGGREMKKVNDRNVP